MCPRCKSRYWNRAQVRQKLSVRAKRPRLLLGEGRALVREHRSEILRIAATHGARRVRLFGSVLRGEDRPDSDIDFIVVMGPGRSLLDRAGLVVDLRELLGRPVDVVTERSLYAPIREKVLSEATPV
jgi:uncharacterized protein